MLFPRSWLQEFVEIPNSISSEEIATALVRVGFEVEEILQSGADLRGPLVVGTVLEIEELTEHKKPIRYVRLDCGEGKDRFVICGARNFASGDQVVVALPGALLPGDFAISARETYGRISDGMICSAKELAMSEDHSGIINLGASGKHANGANAIELLQLHDEIFDIAINPDRGYALSIRGMARELAGSLDLPYSDPIQLLKNRFENKESYFQDKEGAQVSAKIIDGASVIYLRSVDSVNPKAESPLWMRRRLEKSGMRSISLPVDITNYVMLELGQPLHAFDSNSIKNEIQVRRAVSGEVLRTLDGEDRTLDSDSLVIADSERVLALAGTLGGEESEIREETRSITIEAAHFLEAAVARNARLHRISTEASRRFERGVDAHLARYASIRAVELLVELADGAYVGSSVDGSDLDLRKITISKAGISSLVGYEYSDQQFSSALTKIGAFHNFREQFIEIQVPSWRSDIRTLADVAEEIARINGYDLIEPKLALGRSIQSGKPSSLNATRSKAIRTYLATKGLSETLNYPFTSDEFINELGFVGVRASSFKLANPISDDYPVLRTHILQSLIPAAIRNINRGNRDVAIFEIGSIFRKGEKNYQTTILETGALPPQSEIVRLFESVPNQPTMVAGLISGEFDRSGWWGKGRKANWQDALSLALEIIDLCGSKGRTRPSDYAPWHPGRCAEIYSDNAIYGHAGELHPEIVEKLGLAKGSVAFAVILDSIPEGEIVKPHPLSLMPAAIQDISLIVDKDVASGELIEALKAGAGGYLESIELFDRYESIGDGKISLAFTLTFRAPDRTLTSDEIAQFRSNATDRAAQLFGAVLRQA